MSKAIKLSSLVIGFVVLISVFVSADTLYVSPDGSGDYPNIQAAVDAAQAGDIVMLADGTYRGRGNYDVSLLGKAITIRSQSGTAGNVIVDVQGESGNMISERGFVATSGEGNDSVIRDLTIINGDADAPCPNCDGGGIYTEDSSPTIINVIFRDNFGSSGGGFGATGGSPLLRNCTFIDNSAFDGGGVYFFDGASGSVDHCLFYGNHADLHGAGISTLQNASATVTSCTISNNDAPYGGGISVYDSDFDICNTIISFNDSGEAVYYYGESSIAISYCDIFGNEGGDWTGEIANRLGVDGNFSGDPDFIDTLEADYHLVQGSPCIDSGDPTMPLDPDNTVSDIGAFFFNQATGIDEQTASLPESFRLDQNYPNPFNPTTSIDYELRNASRVNLTVYDLLGNQVAVLVDNIEAAGSHNVVWNADVPSGVYFYKMSVDGYSVTKKMVLMK